MTAPQDPDPTAEDQRQAGLLRAFWRGLIAVLDRHPDHAKIAKVARDAIDGEIVAALNEMTAPEASIAGLQEGAGIIEAASRRRAEASRDVPAAEAEDTFLQMLDSLRRDGILCAHFGFTWLAFQASLADHGLVDRLNDHALFWTTVERATETAALISLGRFYDRRDDVWSGHQVLRFAEEHPKLFTAEAVRERAIRRRVAPADADALVERAGQVSRSSFSGLRAAFNANAAIYNQRLKDLRHKVLAHTGQLSLEARSEFLIHHRDIERLSAFPQELQRSLHDMFYNAIAPEPWNRQTLISAVLAERPRPGESKPEYFHAAAATAAFLESLKTDGLAGNRSDDKDL